jgi:hypothetical protein|tara:strand:+ start:10916 stop:11212 length:297 start_codon:yes stop_codon:yes gene_type:complete
MDKFFKVSTASNGTLMIPASDIIWVNTLGGGYTQSVLYLANNSTFDLITVTHAADSVAIKMVTYLQNKLIEVAQGKWSESVLDITDDSPLVISNVTIS